MKDINEILDTIKDQSIEELKSEFKGLLKEASGDSLDFVKKSAASTVRWLSLKAEGLLTEEEVKSLLEARKKEALVFMNTQSIAARAKIQKLVCRLLDIAVNSLVAAL